MKNTKLQNQLNELKDLLQNININDKKEIYLNLTKQNKIMRQQIKFLEKELLKAKQNYNSINFLQDLIIEYGRDSNIYKDNLKLVLQDITINNNDLKDNVRLKEVFNKLKSEFKDKINFLEMVNNEINQELQEVKKRHTFIKKNYKID